MNYKEFLEYLENNLEGYSIFMEKALEFQNSKNKGRKRPWNEIRLQKEAYDMWKKSMETLYNSLKDQVKSDSKYSWKSFIEKNDVLGTVNDSIRELDFSYSEM